LHPKSAEMDATNKRKAKRKPAPDAENLLVKAKNIDKYDKKKLPIYAGSEEKLLNLVVEIVVKIILKEIL
jgi:hypothetical protein